MSVLRHWKREHDQEELDDQRIRQRPWHRVSHYARLPFVWGRGRIYVQTVWSDDAPVTRKGRRDLWILSGLIVVAIVVGAILLYVF